MRQRVSSETRAFLIVVMIGFALRLWAAVAVGSFAPGGDAKAYLILGKMLVSGQGLVTESGNYGLIRGMYPPLYPLILAFFGSFFFGITISTVALLNTCLDLASCVIIRRTAGGRVGTIAASIYFLWPSFILSCPVAQKESLVLLIVVNLFAIFIARPRLSCFSARLGLCWGLLALSQPSLVTLPILLWLSTSAIDRKFDLISLAGTIGVFSLTMAPWWIRNWFVFGHFVPFTLSAGASLRVALFGHHMPLTAQMKARPEYDRLVPLTRIAFNEIDHSKLIYLKRTFWQLFSASVRDSAAAARVHVLDYRQIAIICQFTYSGVQIISIFALYARRNKIWLILLAGCVLQIVFFDMWFEFKERPRDFILPILFVLASGTILNWCERRRGVPAHTVGAVAA